MQHNILVYLEKTAIRHAGRVAVDDGNIRYSWEELTRLSREMGTAFCKRTEPGKPIVLMMEKSAVTLAAMLGVVYAGCFYVMIDPVQPARRIREILSVLSPDMILTSQESREKLLQADYDGEILLIRDVMGEPEDAQKLAEIRQKSCDTDLLYGIFTSGSTGMPKGIVVSHRAVIDFITHFVELFEFSEKDRIGNQAPFDFDVSVKDIYTSIMTGAQLVLIPRRMFSTPSVLLDYLCEKKVNTLIWAVSALTLVSAMKGLRYKVPTDVKRVMFSGEVMPVKQLRQWQMALPEAQFVNLYGPSEITCNCTYYPVRRIFGDREKLPIGKAFPGREVFLLNDKGGRIRSAGKTGEICVAGESLAQGYYHNQEETEKRFVSLRLGKQTKRCYRTGDLGYYDLNGELCFSGRKDFQIKHMGHRIELEEIEYHMNQIDGVEKSCCFLDERRNQLTAFYYGTAAADGIKRELRNRMPAYMVPQKMILMEELPLNKNGKTDRAYFKNQLEVAM